MGTAIARQINWSSPSQRSIISARRFASASDKAEQLETALTELVGSPVRLVFAVSEGPVAATAATAESNRPMSSRQREMQLMQHPLVERASELFDARPMFGKRVVEIDSE